MSSSGSSKLVVSMCQSPFVAAFVSSLSLPLLLLILIFAKWVIENRTHKLMTIGTNSSEQVHPHPVCAPLSQCLSPKSPAFPIPTHEHKILDGVKCGINKISPCEPIYCNHQSCDQLTNQNQSYFH